MSLGDRNVSNFRASVICLTLFLCAFVKFNKSFGYYFVISALFAALAQVKPVPFSADFCHTLALSYRITVFL
jgi:hypothetical protein